MRRKILLLGVGAAAAGFLALSTSADIVNTLHNFSNVPGNWAQGEICKPCHTPHFADPDVGYLWAHALSEAPYTLYDGSTSSLGGVDELDVYSRMCLSCHDGTVALNNFHNGTGPNVFIPPGKDLTQDLSDDHPIGDQAPYDTAGAAGRFNAPVQSPSGVWGFGGTFFPEVPLFEHNAEQVVSCSSCHTPHGRAGVDFLLRKDNAVSSLCLTCHIK